VRPNIWASRRSDSGLPACTLSRYAAMGSATAHIQVGTWIANIYLRHSYTCAKGASLIADATGGRFILGLGVSHQPVNDALAVDMTNAPADLHRYVLQVRDWLDGKGPTTHLPQQPAPVQVPVYIATLSLPAVERAAQIADGIMPTMWSPERVTQAAARGRAWPCPGTAPATPGHHPGPAHIHRG
jgi:alkanesulfonate monooxygenase SsuD/methylene tetrahydromethanopterin reductase-like flavin-dependent oxidoreductase (luciferase family)